MVQTANVGFTLMAKTCSFGAGSFDVWLVKIGIELGLAWTDSTANTIILPRGETDAYWDHVQVRIWKIKENL